MAMKFNNGIAVLLEFNLKAASPLYARECINRLGMRAHASALCHQRDPVLVAKQIYIYDHRQKDDWNYFNFPLL